LTCSNAWILDGAIEVAARCPISQFQPLEIRPFADGLQLDRRASAFAGEQDTAGAPYLPRRKTELSDGPFTKLEEHLASIDVLDCSDRQQAIDLAATYPIASYYTIDVRPLYSA
jgi:hypothetical protein